MTRRRFLAMALILAMCLSCLPVPALGTEGSEGSPRCSCSVQCTEDSVNDQCPVCGGESGNPTACAPQASEPAKCVCTAQCAEDSVNDQCPVCGGENGDPAACAPQASEPAKCVCTAQCAEDSVNDQCPVCGRENGNPTACAPQASEPAKCICTTRCAEDSVNDQCPVCGGENGVLTACVGTAGETSPPADAAMPEGLNLRADDGSPLTAADYSYSAGSGILSLTSGRAMTLSGSTTACRVVIGSGVSGALTLDAVSIAPTGPALALEDGASLALTLRGSSTLTGSEGYAGLRVRAGTSVTISGSGSLTARGGTRGAGIGGSESEDGGSVTILSGTVSANGGQHAAGIGGGMLASGGCIAISGGSVTANGGQFAAGIGGSGMGSAGSVTISGGFVTANGGQHGAGIGCGTLGSTGSVIISGGSVNASSISGTPTNSSGQSVSLTLITLDGLENAAAVSDIAATSSDSGSYFYGTAGVRTTENGTLYLYLPEDVTVTGIIAGGISYGTGDGISGGTDGTLRPKQTPSAGDFTFTAPEDLLYSGSGKAAAVTTDRSGMGSITVRYFSGTEALDAPPTEAGSYTVKIDVTPGRLYTGASGLTDEDWRFEILSAPVTALDLTGLLPAPEKGQTPPTAIAHTQYTGTVVWSNNPPVFLGSTVYTARVVLTPTGNYSFAGRDTWDFLWNEEAAPAETASDGTVSLCLTFPATSPREVTGISISQPPEKTIYDIGEAFDPRGMTVTATYDDGTSGTVTEGLRFRPETIEADTSVISVCLGDAFAEIPISIPEALKEITAPDPIEDLTNGTAKTAAALGLPETVDILTDGGNAMKASVIWDLSDCGYVEAEPGQQSFTVRGIVRLPETVSNRNQLPLTVCVSVSVKAAAILSGFPPRDTSPDSADTDESVSGIAENQDFPLGNTLTISLQSVLRGELSYVPAKWSTNPSGFFENTGSGYTATIKTAGMTPGAHVLSLFYQETDAATGTATGNVVKTEIHYSLQSPSTVTTEPTAPTYIVTASAGSGGSISPAGRVAVEGGVSIRFRIHAEEDYVIADVTVDGRSIGAVDSYTFKEIWANHTIAATFRSSLEAPPITNPTQPSRPSEAPKETLPYPTLPPVSAGEGGSIPMYVPVFLLLLALLSFGAALLIYRRPD